MVIHVSRPAGTARRPAARARGSRARAGTGAMRACLRGGLRLCRRASTRGTWRTRRLVRPGCRQASPTAEAGACGAVGARVAGHCGVACGAGDWWPPEGFCWSNTRPRRGIVDARVRNLGSALSGKHDKALMKAPADEPPSCCRVRREQRLRRRGGYVRRLQPRRREGRQGGARARAACRAAAGAAAWPGARD